MPQGWSQATTDWNKWDENWERIFRMKAKDFETGMSPWFGVSKWRLWAEENGVLITEGPRHNRMDGEIHYVLQHGDETYNMHANCYDSGSGWQAAIDWIESFKG